MRFVSVRDDDAVVWGVLADEETVCLPTNRPLAERDPLALFAQGVGCASEPAEFLNDGDRVESEIQGLGVLSNSVVRVS